jgi:hypothetical protein
VASRAVRALLASSGSLLLGVAALVDSGIAEEPLLATLVALEVPGGRTGAS